MTQEMDVENQEAYIPTKAIFLSGNGSAFNAGGPLADQIAQALFDQYKRIIDPNGNIVLESQQQAEMMAKNIIIAQKTLSPEYNGVNQDIGLLYGVQELSTNQGDIIEVTDYLSDCSPERKQCSGVVIFSQKDPTQGSACATGQIENPFTTALEAICKKNNVPVYRSMTEFINKNS